ncbi:unnamed protein product [Diamesa hyperborea]
MLKFEVFCLLVTVFCVIQLSIALPVRQEADGNELVDEIIFKLKQLKQQNEGEYFRSVVTRNFGKGNTKIAQAKKIGNDADRRALLYNYFTHGLNGNKMEVSKRNFDEIDRLGSWNDFDKRNFDEIDRFGLGEF